MTLLFLCTSQVNGTQYLAPTIELAKGVGRVGAVVANSTYERERLTCSRDDLQLFWHKQRKFCRCIITLDET